MDPSTECPGSDRPVHRPGWTERAGHGSYCTTPGYYAPLIHCHRSGDIKQIKRQSRHLLGLSDAVWTVYRSPPRTVSQWPRLSASCDLVVEWSSAGQQHFRWKPVILKSIPECVTRGLWSPVISPLTVQCVNSSPLTAFWVIHQTAPLKIQVGAVHGESIQLQVLCSVCYQIILGQPWLQEHNPHLNLKVEGIWALSESFGKCLFLPCRVLLVKSPWPEEVSTILSLYQ